MRVEPVSYNSFKGNLILDADLASKERRYLKRIMSKKVNGISNKNYLEKHKVELVLTEKNVL